MSFRLADYHFALPGQPLPPVDESLLCDYVIGANGAYVRARKPGLEACALVARFSMRGLRPVAPYAQWGFPKVPASFLEKILSISRSVCAGQAAEALFHLSWGESPVDFHAALLDSHAGWHLEFPEQRADSRSVVPLHSGAGTSTERAAVELHSHHFMGADFSPEDDRDEAQGFRVYAVLGTIFDQPTIRARVGIFGYFLEFAATEFFELPEGWIDCMQA